MSKPSREHHPISAAEARRITRLSEVTSLKRDPKSGSSVLTEDLTTWDHLAIETALLVAVREGLVNPECGRALARKFATARKTRITWDAGSDIEPGEGEVAVMLDIAKEHGPIEL